MRLFSSSISDLKLLLSFSNKLKTKIMNVKNCIFKSKFERQHKKRWEKYVKNDINHYALNNVSKKIY